MVCLTSTDVVLQGMVDVVVILACETGTIFD